MIVSILCLSGAAQNTTRRNLKLRHDESVVTAVRDSSAATLRGIKVSGYDKAQRSATESMFVTNDSDSLITAINITIRYYDETKRLLHERTETRACHIPAGETRHITLKAWDRQQLWYYHGTQGRHDRHSTPYDVRVKVNFVER